MPEPVTLEDLKSWCRVDFDDDDTLLTNLGVAAREFIEQATGRTYAGTDAETIPEKGKTAIKMLVAHWYEAREPIVVGAPVVNVPLHVRSVIHQLRNWQDPALVEATV